MTKTIILTGAGAARPWEAPTTNEITNKICTNYTYRSRTGQAVGGWFLDKLRNFYHINPECVNFETILNTIDWLCSFYGSDLRQAYSQFKIQLPAFLKGKDDISEIIDFNRIYEHESNMWTAKKGQKFNESWHDIDYFFESLYRYFINLIIEEIEKYDKQCLDDKFKNLNESLNTFFRDISESHALRTYTLNYDRIFPKVSTIELFEGFTNVRGNLEFNRTKVLGDSECNCFYNLHGSIYYDEDWPYSVKLNPNKPIYSFGSSSGDSNDQESRKLINSNIVTGLNKSSRILQNPYSQFYHSFYKDCIEAEIVYIIGYSFSDIHINKAISEGSIINSQQKIIVVGNDILNGENEANFNKEIDFLEMTGRDTMNLLGQQHNIFNIVEPINAERIKYFRKGFKKFLEWKVWDE